MEGDQSDYVIVAENSTDELQTPLKRSARLKYNCISASSKLVAIGSNTGGIYVFSRSDQKLLQIAFADKETGSVSTVKISPHEKYVAFTSSTNVHVLDLRLESRGAKAETLKTNAIVGYSVTCLLWDHSSTKLYVGNDLGNVCVMSVSSSKAKNIFSLPMEVIMKLDSSIVQIDNIEDKILVSTLTRCYLCLTTKQQYSQIGQKLRDGSYGACFMQQPMCAPMIYCARPGSRIWEVDFEGTVLNTHQFKQLLSVPPRTIVDLEQNYEQFVTTANTSAQSVAFPKLTVLRNRYLLTWTTNSVYVLDPINVKVILWTNQFSDIQDVCCVDSYIYIFFKSMKIQSVSFLDVTSVLPVYMKTNNLDAAVNMCISHRQIFTHKHVRKRFGVDDMSCLYDRLVELDKTDLAEQIKDIVIEMEEQMAKEAAELEASASYVRNGPNVLTTDIDTQDSSSSRGAGDGESEITVCEESHVTVTKETITEQIIEKNGELEKDKTKLSLNEIDHVETNGLTTLTEEGDACMLVNSEKVKDILEQSGHLTDDAKSDKDSYVDQGNDVESSQTNNDVKRPTDSGVYMLDNSDPEINPSDLNSEQNSSNNEQNNVDQTSSKLTVPSPHLRTISPVSMDTASDDMLLADDDDVGYLPTVGLGTRRLSATSLSSLSSAEVFMETPQSYENEITDPIAMPVRRRSARKKSRRKSAIEISTTASTAVQRSLSTGLWKSKSSSKDISPQGSVRSLKEEDSISIYSNDSVTMEDGPVTMVTAGTKDEDTADGLSDSKSVDFLPGSPVSYSEEFSQSGEFSKNADYLQSGEFSPGETTQSMERKKQGMSKAALMQLKNKMQNKVSTKTKVLIRNIKEKNLLTKAKELAGNLSQGSEAYLYSGEMPFSENPSLQMPTVNLETDVKNSFNNNVEAANDDVPEVSIDLTELKEVTAKTVDKLQDITVFCDAELLRGVLEDWMVVFNGVFQTLHKEMYVLTKDGPNGKDSKEDSLENDKDRLIGNNDEHAINKLDVGEIANTPASKGTVVTENKQELSELTEMEKHKTKNNCDEITKLIKSSDFCYIKDPLHLPEDLLHQVCDLVQACFDIRCHGNILRFINFNVNETSLCDKTSIVPDVDSSTVNCDITEFDTETGKDHEVETKDNGVVSDKSSDVNTVRNEADCFGEKDELNKYSVVNTEEDSDVGLNCNDPATTETKPNEVNQSCDIDKNVKTGEQVSEEMVSDSSSYNDVQNCLKDEADGSENGYTENCSGISDKEDIGKSTGIVECRSVEMDRAERECEDCMVSGEDNIGMDTSEDYIMGLFIRCYFPYLNVSRVREQCRTTHGCYHVWSALVTCMEEKSCLDAEKFGVEEKSLICYMIENQAHCDDGAALLGHVSKLLGNNHSSIVDVCVRCHPYLQPLDVLYLCKYHTVSMDTVYKQYMQWLTTRASAATRKQVLQYLATFTEAGFVWLDMLLSDNDLSLKVMDEDGCPRHMSHAIRWKCDNIVNEFINLVVEDDLKQKLVDLFRKYGYWIGVLKLMKSLGHRHDHLLLVLQLGDMHLLGSSKELGYLPQCVAEWEELLSMFAELSKSRNQHTEVDSADWSNLITWDNLAILLVKNVGAESAVSLLNKVNISEVTLSTHFYQTCLLSGMVKKQQRLILHSMLEKVDTYLWSQRPTALNPQMQYLALTEKKLSVSESSDVNSDILPNMVNHIQKQNLELYVEDPECHWGIENKINQLCKCCCITLQEIVSHEEPGVLVFKCGHSYHKFCLPGKECLVCVDKK